MIIVSGVHRAAAATNGVALTPPMGVNTWYSHGAYILESEIKSIADQMVTYGLLAAGYNYLCVDDGWAGGRDTNGTIIANPVRFPSGMKALADYVHSKGLKFGLYTVYGPRTCAGFTGSYGHVEQDAQTFAEWGVDYLKYEQCTALPEPSTFQDQIELMANALKATGRPIVFSASIGDYEPWQRDSLNLWRGTGDHNKTWTNVLHHIDFVARTPEVAGPGGWNDPDVLPFFWEFSQIEWRSIFSMWCILSAPLLSLNSGLVQAAVLTNAEAVAVDQDAAGIQGVCVATNGELQVWAKPLGSRTSGIVAVALFNRGTNSGTITARWSDLGLPPGVALVRDLWAHAAVGHFTNEFSAMIPGHTVRLLKITAGATTPVPAPGTNYLSNLDWLASTTNTFPTLPPRRDRSISGGIITLRGVPYEKGLGVYAVSHVEYYLGGVASRFQSTIGIDDVACCGRAAAIFRVSADGTVLYESGVMTSSSLPEVIDIDVRGKTFLTLDVVNVQEENWNNQADWAGARVIADPRLRFASVALEGGTIVLRGTGGAAGAPYYIETSTNAPAASALWSRAVTNAFDTTGAFEAVESIQSHIPQRFYRVVVP